MEKEKQLIPQLRFPEFEGEWEKVIISEIADKITDGTHDTHKPIKEGIPFLTAIHVKDGNIAFDNCYYLSEEEHNKIYKRCNPEFGDLLMVNIGAGTATSAMVNVNHEFSLKNVALIKPNKTKIYPKFFAQIQRKNSDRLRHQISSGGAQPFLSLKAIGKLKLNIPQLPEQQKIASFLTAIDTKITKLTKKKDLLAQYKKGVMQKIFNQELRFKDDNGNDFTDWEEKQLRDIANYRRGSFPQPYGLPKWYDKVNGTPFVQVYDVGNNMLLKPSTKHKISALGSEQSVFVAKGTIIITIQASIGRIAKTQYDSYVDRTLLIFQSYKIPLNLDYFKYVLFLLFEIEKRKAPGGIIKTITKEVLSSFNVMLPSIEEQTKIANFLSAIDLKIEALNTKIENSKNFKKGLLQQMFV